MLEHVAEQHHVERPRLQLRERGAIDVGDVHALGERLGPPRRLGVELDADHAVATLSQMTRDVTRPAPDLEHALVAPDEPDRRAVGVVVGVGVDRNVVLRVVGHQAGDPNDDARYIRGVVGDLYITGDDEADGLLNHDPAALIVGMLLDQQVPMGWAFAGPLTIRRRLGHLDVARIAALDEHELVQVCCAKPAIHRFPAVMGSRIHAMCSVLTEHYEGDVERLWADAPTGNELYRRLRELPGFGDEKARIFIALLAKRFGVRPDGWQQAAGVFADDEPRTIADCHDDVSLAAVREWKQTQRAERRDKQGRPLPQGAD